MSLFISILILCVHYHIVCWHRETVKFSNTLIVDTPYLTRWESHGVSFVRWKYNLHSMQLQLLEDAICCSPLIFASQWLVWGFVHNTPYMKTSLHGNAFHITGFLYEESTSPMLIPLTKGQKCRSLMLSLLLAWSRCWRNNWVVDEFRSMG